MKRLILFLVRRHLGLKKYQYFQFDNQKSTALYYFANVGIVKYWRGKHELSRVSINWIINNECRIVKMPEYGCEFPVEKKPNDKKDKEVARRQLDVAAGIVAIVSTLAMVFLFCIGMHRVSNTEKCQSHDDVITYSSVSPEETTPTTESSEREANSEQATEPATEPTTKLIKTSHDTYISSESTEPTTEYTEVTETAECIPEVNEEDVELLAMVIYQEVGSDSVCDDCRRRVADIVLNRVNSDLYPDTIEEVLTQYSQYGNYYYTGVKWSYNASNPNEAHAVERARRIAREVLEGQHSELYGNNYLFQAGFVQGVEGFWCCGIYYGKFGG